MQKIEMGMEEPWFKDPSVADIFGGRADVGTVEGASIIIRIHDGILDLVELTVARFHGDDEWVWDTPDAYGYAKDLGAAKAAAMKRGWHDAMLRLREEVATEVEGPLDRIAKTAAVAVRERREKGSEDDREN
ncbi:hypothetical protein G6M78_13515 [Agrobacterium tumefaciens]|uniref:hypothetical protein n=1 Tax=Agrobacterium tumefaciens TaxID=358 RepID=UPI001573E875|nr:hypothetical protein [Agrobacterium tumefaciens]NTE56090.1 hypothetical protein [Agrobacterium tumefaciens]NTE74200.1 hypothetical protein [Agrobacterium tumefaciens]